MAASRSETDTATSAVRRVWEGVCWYARGVLGGSKYDGYLAWHARHGEGVPMTEKDYWRHRSEHEERNPQGRCC